MLDNQLRQRFFSLVLDLGIGIQAQIEELLGEYGLTFTQSMFLFRLYGEGDIQFKDLVKCQKISKGAVSQIINVLQEKELVAKEQSSKDKRDWYIRLTPKSKNILKEINQKRGEEMQFMYAGIDNDSLKNIVQNLQLIKQNIDDQFK